jgi:S-adenosylmethionine synthetase
MSILVDTFGTEQVDPDAIVAAVREVFDLRPGAIVRDLDLLRPGYQRTAAYGHFGREGFSWETLSRLNEFKSAVGV